MVEGIGLSTFDGKTVHMKFNSSGATATSPCSIHVRFATFKTVTSLRDGKAESSFDQRTTPNGMVAFYLGDFLANTTLWFNVTVSSPEMWLRPTVFVEDGIVYVVCVCMCMCACMHG